MTKEKAKKYISGRQLEIMCELEIVTTHKMRERLAKEFSFLKYVNNVLDYIDDECDDIPPPTTFEHKGYVLQQSNYTNHYMIFKNNSVVLHASCTGKLTENEAKEHIERYINSRREK